MTKKILQVSDLYIRSKGHCGIGALILDSEAMPFKKKIPYAMTLSRNPNVVPHIVISFVNFILNLV